MYFVCVHEKIRQFANRSKLHHEPGWSLSDEIRKERQKEQKDAKYINEKDKREIFTVHQFYMQKKKM